MYRLRNFLCYVSFAVAITSLIPANPTLGSYLAVIGAFLLFFAVDLDSYREGLARGTETAAGYVEDLVKGRK